MRIGQVIVVVVVVTIDIVTIRHHCGIARALTLPITGRCIFRPIYRCHWLIIVIIIVSLFWRRGIVIGATGDVAIVPISNVRIFAAQ